MSLEDATYIPQLNAAWPDGDADDISQGDDQLRMLKRVLQTVFNSLGNAALAVTAAQINAAVLSSGQYATGTSTTSLLIGAGAKAFTTQPSRGFAVGQRWKLTSNADVNNFMIGTGTAYDLVTGAATMSVDLPGGSGTFADWSLSVLLDARTLINRSPRTSNTPLGVGDSGSWVDITAGTFSQTFDPVATLGAKWWCILSNSGTGDATLDPNAAETIDGLASYIMYPGEVRFVQCDGVALRTIVWNGYSKTFTVSGNWTKPPGYRSHDGELDGAGGSGGRNAVGALRSGGAGGARVLFSYPSAQLSATEAVTIGAPGAAVTTDNTSGNAGGLTQFKNVIAYGGQGGSNAGTVGQGGNAYFSAALNPTDTGAISTGAADYNWDGHFGGGSGRNALVTRGRSVYGNGAGGTIDTGNAYIPPLASIFGNLGGTTNAAGTAPATGAGPGAGGGASSNGTASAPGMRGEARLWGMI